MGDRDDPRKVSPPTRRSLRNCPHLPSSGFRRDGGQSRAGKEVFPAIEGGEIMETAIRVRAVRSALHGSENAAFPSSRKPDLHQSRLVSIIGRNRRRRNR